MGVTLGRIGDDSSIDGNIDIRNITATFVLSGEFDLEALSEDLPHSEYDPDKHRSLIYRPPTPAGTVVLLPPRGRVSLAGAQDKNDIRTGADRFVKDLSTLGIDREVDDVRVENMVATTDLGRSLDLSALTISLGLETTEYEPEQFPGVIHRLESSVVLLFASGKVVITKVQTYDEVLSVCMLLKSKIENLPL